MLVPVLLFTIGLIGLIKGGDWFVDGATGIAHQFHLPELLIGATVVSIGTTLPEVMVSTTSALTGHGEIAYGNAIGSVICNTALIAAITVAIQPGTVDRKTLRTPVLFFFTAALLYAGVAYTSGYFSRPVGLILLTMFVAYIILTVRQMAGHSLGFFHHGKECLPDHGHPGYVRSDAPIDNSSLVQRQTAPSAGNHPSSDLLCILRNPVYDVRIS